MSKTLTARCTANGELSLNRIATRRLDRSGAKPHAPTSSASHERLCRARLLRGGAG